MFGRVLNTPLESYWIDWTFFQGMILYLGLLDKHFRNFLFQLFYSYHLKYIDGADYFSKWDVSMAQLFNTT